MKKTSKSVLLTLIPVVGATVGLAACKPAQSPGDVCSAQVTYTGLNKLIASRFGSNADPDLQSKLKAFIQYTMTTVEAVDKDTDKVTCNSVMRFSGSTEGVRAIEGAFVFRKLLQIGGQSDDPDDVKMPLQINDQSADHVSFQIHYSVQPTADKTDNVIYLADTDPIAQVMSLGISAAKKANSPTTPAATAVPDNSITPQENAQSSNGNDDADGNNSLPSANSSTSTDTPISHKIKLAPSDMANIEVGMKLGDVRQNLLAAGWKLEPFNDSYDGQCWRKASNRPVGDQQGLCQYTYDGPDGRYLLINTNTAYGPIQEIDAYDGDPANAKSDY